MNKYNKVYLCGSDPGELYLEKIDCNESDPSVFDFPECHFYPGCMSFVRARNLTTGEEYNKCLSCRTGYKPKLVRPQLYDLDVDLCQREELSLQIM